MSHQDNQHIYGANAEYIESLYQLFLKDPSQVSAGWQNYFNQLDNHKDRQIHGRRSTPPAGHAGRPVRDDAPADALQEKQRAVLRLIRAYRRLGHRQADIDPLYGEGRIEIDLLNPENHGLTAADYDGEFFLWEEEVGNKQTLRSILNLMSSTYCGSIGAETEHISDPEQKNWLRKYLEANFASINYSRDKKKRILTRLIAANALETYLHQKYVGQKRFSLEGGTSLIPLLDTLIQSAGSEYQRSHYRHGPPRQAECAGQYYGQEPAGVI